LTVKNNIYCAAAVFIAFTFQSCFLSPPGVKSDIAVPKENNAVETGPTRAGFDIVRMTAEEIILEDEEVIIPENNEPGKIVEIYKDDILNNCERKFLEMLKYYNSGELRPAKLLFDNILESLEYLYGDRKVPDTEMLERFWSEFSDRELAQNLSITDIYRNLYYENKQPEADELVIEQTGSEAFAAGTALNNSEFLYVEDKLNALLSGSKTKPDPDFTRKVHESYSENLNDRIRLKEIYIRAVKYSDFIKEKLAANGLDPVYFFLPSVNTAYYEGRNNGSVWGLEKSKNYCERARNSTGASTAIVISLLKEHKKKYGDLKTISSIVETGRYDLDSSDITGDVYSDNAANFFAMAILLGNPEDHELSADASKAGEDTYSKDYADYLKDKNKFCSVKNVSKKKPSAKPVSESKGSGAFIRINYKVKKGDNLQKIADIFGVTVNQIKEWNPKDAGKKFLSPGANLFIRGDNFQYYTALSGDSVGKISSKFKMSDSDFKKINELRSNTIIKGRKYIVKKN
jgi:LysM repeat protein